MKTKKNTMTVSDFARMGGQAVSQKLGSEHMAQIASQGRRNLEKKDPEFYKRLAEAGNHARQVKIQAKIAKELGDTSSLDLFVKMLIGG